MSYPNDFNCPIGLNLLKDPVICDDGITYERSTIENWFNQDASKIPNDSNNRISPMTKKIISTNLIPNLALKNSIDEFLKNNKNIVIEDVINDENLIIKFENIKMNLESISPEEDLQLVCNGVEYEKKNFKKYGSVFFSMVPPNSGTKNSTVYINVVDVSGSMQLPAMNDNNNKEGEFLYSRLDLVKFSLENIVENCTENDQFALVTFSNESKIVMPISAMNLENKKKAKDLIYEQSEQGCTNLWAGILTGLELAKSDICKDKNVSIIVLTDGEANSNPPEGVFAALKSYLNKNEIKCSIHTIGFGYDIDAKLLFDIALKVGNGTYCFIPDFTMIGTNVTSLIAKNKSCFAKDVQLTYSVNGADLNLIYKNELNVCTSLYESSKPKENNFEEYLNFGQMDFGQKKDFFLNLKNIEKDCVIKMKVTYDLCGQIKSYEKEFDLKMIKDENKDSINELVDRNKFIECLIELIELRTKNEKNIDKTIKNKIESLIKELKKTKNEKYIREFENNVHDFEGQVLKAVTNADWYRKWGLSHILYLLSSHLRRFNANFKDPSIQSYGGEIFENYRNECEYIFCNLQQPKPSIKSSDENAPQISIAQACCNYSAGCFTGDGEILMKNGELKLVKNLVPGDELTSWNNETCKIICIIKTRCLKSIKIVRLNGLKITQYHPVYIGNKWEFPINLSTTEEISCDYIYNLVVDRQNVVNINGIYCVTLGHNYIDDVVAHPYFGSINVINDLKIMKGWKNGLITIECLLVTRDENTGLINSMIQGEYKDKYIHSIDKLSCFTLIETI